jgi:hypothetical protein
MLKFVPCINNFAARKAFPYCETLQTGEKKPMHEGHRLFFERSAQAARHALKAI